MSFFDKKEEVIEIQLTQFGKQLLSVGKFKPAYYEFFDDDILYDSEYGGFEETKLQTSERIKNETPSLKVQYTYHGIETEFEKSKSVLRKERELLSQNMQQTIDKNYALSAQLGNSSLSSEYYPAWDIKFLKGEISGTVNYKTGSFATLQIPQIDVKPVTFYTYPEKAESGEDEVLPNAIDGQNNLNKRLAENDLARGSEASDLNFSTTRFEDGTYIKIEDDFILISVDELNTDLLGKNFDIEVFLEETDNKTGLEVLTPLYYEKNKKMIDENNILLDQDLERPKDIKDLDPSYVEHFFYVYVDNEINKEILCNLVPKSERETMFSGEIFDCEEFRAELSDNSRLYDSDVRPQDLEEDC